MIFAEWKPLAELTEKLRGYDRVLLVGCATCVAECAAGGEKEVETLAPLLRMAMREQGHDVQIETATLEKQCEWEFVEQVAGTVSQVDAVLSIACGIGVQAMAERYDETPVFPASTPQHSRCARSWAYGRLGAQPAGIACWGRRSGCARWPAAPRA